MKTKDKLLVDTAVKMVPLSSTDQWYETYKSGMIPVEEEGRRFGSAKRTQDAAGQARILSTGLLHILTHRKAGGGREHVECSTSHITMD